MIRQFISTALSFWLAYGLGGGASINGLPSFPRACAAVVSLEQRISSYRQQSTHPGLSFDAQEQLQQQLGFLSDLNAALLPLRGCDGRIGVEETALEGAEGLFAKLRQHPAPSLTPLQVWHLSEYIEDSIGEWRQHPERSIPAHAIRHPDGRVTTVDFRLDKNGRLFVDFHLPPFSGGYGSVYPLFGYRTHENAAKKVIKNPDPLPPNLILSQFGRQRESLRRARDIRSRTRALRVEQHNLDLIAKLPAEHQTGLVHTLTSKEGEILQLLYDGDLDTRIKAAVAHDQAPPDHEMVKLFVQLGEGLNTLHTKLGMVHSDIKPQNILLRMASPHSPHEQAVLADFGLSYVGSEALALDPNRQRIKGTPGYLPPEAPNPWVGKDNAEKIVNAQKGDVFALSVALAKSIRPQLLAWRTCGTPDRVDFSLCFANAINQLRVAVQAKPDPICSLLLRGMSGDLASRPTAADWTHELKQIEQHMAYTNAIPSAGDLGADRDLLEDSTSSEKKSPPKKRVNTQTHLPSSTK